MSKLVVLTGSPKNAGFSTKAVFMKQFSAFGFEEGKVINADTMLITDDMSSNTTKMQKAAKCGSEIMTYEELKDLYELQGDLF